jgi:hypothetical protein
MPEESDTTNFDEKNTPLDTDALLPVRTTTLARVPAPERFRYRADPDGEHYNLRYLTSGHPLTQAILTRHAREISAGDLKFHLLAEGETPASVEEKQRRGDEMAAKVLKMANDADATRRNDEREASRKRAQAELDATYGRRDDEERGRRAI